MLTIVKGIRTTANDIFGNIFVQMSTERFADWLRREIDHQKLNQSQLAEITGLTTAGVSKILSGERNAGPEACRGIAKALILTEDFVFRKAGLLSPQAGYDVTYEEWRQILNELNDQNRQELLHIARLRLERQRDEAWSHKFSELTPAQQEEVKQFMIRKGWIQKDVSTGSPDPRKSE